MYNITYKMVMTMISVLCLDDEPEFLEIARHFLEQTGDITVRICTSPTEALSLLQTSTCDIVISDYQMPEMNGITFLKKTREVAGSIPFILFTGHGGEEVVIEAINNGADRYLQKGGDPVVRFAELADQIRGLAGDWQEQQTLCQRERQQDLLTRIARHDLMNTLQTMQGYLDLAQAIFPAERGGAVLIGHLEDTIQEIQSQVEFITLLQNPRAISPSWHRLIDLLPGDSLPPSIQFLTDLNGIEIYTGPMLEKVFANLLDNSLRHGEKVTSIRVSSFESAGRTIVVWEDDGVGIPHDEKERIFLQGYGKHTGEGMFLIRELLSLIDCTITETGTPKEGARFELGIPSGILRRTGQKSSDPLSMQRSDSLA